MSKKSYFSNLEEFQTHAARVMKGVLREDLNEIFDEFPEVERIDVHLQQNWGMPSGPTKDNSTIWFRMYKDREGKDRIDDQDFWKRFQKRVDKVEFNKPLIGVLLGTKNWKFYRDRPENLIKEAEEEQTKEKETAAP